MTSVARYLLTESEAHAVIDAIDGTDILDTLPTAIGEADGGRWRVEVYLSGMNDKGEVAALARTARNVLGRDPGKPFLEKLPDTDWVAKSLEGLAPVHAGRFLVHGGHDRDRRKPNEISIEIEAGEAFGTGHHGTTAGCLIAIDRLLARKRIVNALDVGTGSGVLAIALAKAAKASVLATDIDPVAVRVARDNVHQNGVARHVQVIEANTINGGAFDRSGPYDLIVANILAGPLVTLAPSIRRRTAAGGTVILSGLLPEQRARIVATYRSTGLRLRRSDVLNGWLTLVFAA